MVPAGVAGIAITVAGTNFHPGGGDDGADEPAIVCVFAGVEGPSAIVPARLVAGGGASCDVPFNPSPSGFVSVGLSGNGAWMPSFSAAAPRRGSGVHRARRAAFGGGLPDVGEG